MGNRYGARDDEFDWTLGAKRRLRRYLKSGLSYAEAARLLDTTRGSIASAAFRFGLQMSVEQQREHQARQAWERARHGRRSMGTSWEQRLVETWEERKARLARERFTRNPAPSTPASARR